MCQKRGTAETGNVKGKMSGFLVCIKNDDGEDIALSTTIPCSVVVG